MAVAILRLLPVPSQGKGGGSGIGSATPSYRRNLAKKTPARTNILNHVYKRSDKYQHYERTNQQSGKNRI